MSSIKCKCAKSFDVTFFWLEHFLLGICSNFLNRLKDVIGVVYNLYIIASSLRKFMKLFFWEFKNIFLFPIIPNKQKKKNICVLNIERLSAIGKITEIIFFILQNMASKNKTRQTSFTLTFLHEIMVSPKIYSTKMLRIFILKSKECIHQKVKNVHFEIKEKHYSFKRVCTLTRWITFITLEESNNLQVDSFVINKVKIEILKNNKT